MKSVEEIKSEISEKITELYQTIQTEKKHPTDSRVLCSVDLDEEELILTKVKLYKKEQEKVNMYDEKVKHLAQEGFSLEEIAVEMKVNDVSDIRHIDWVIRNEATSRNNKFP